MDASLEDTPSASQDDTLPSPSTLHRCASSSAVSESTSATKRKGKAKATEPKSSIADTAPSPSAMNEARLLHPGDAAAKASVPILLHDLTIATRLTDAHGEIAALCGEIVNYTQILDDVKTAIPSSSRSLPTDSSPDLASVLPLHADPRLLPDVACCYARVCRSLYVVRGRFV
ncbi:hypothetical protein PUNSTDRAFT_138171 [Punctularia strigosozonata HHB-11173 SS5]|uniref:Uncharacterized protein n=1 Tax=Punctularia strigosozonata (strain HHB-11173) TaxID=741275 RepID=R7S3K1_PUNST|nr:uncharacterized protein PUNSTDRAFT_138171 [Punctularia strigosozonata HHB-11173 SS5]EIN04985.1 hypothetical protein PUNSTDRAFT_138171 [Punctularia strigosozonata HHB-11173 SS5]